jgi:hypothetical protein
MEYWRRHRTAKTAWLHGHLPSSKTRLDEAMARGTVIPKDPLEVQATPPRLIGLSPQERRLALIRQRAAALVEVVK